MWPDQVSKAGPLTYESGALQTALRSLAGSCVTNVNLNFYFCMWLTFTIMICWLVVLGLTAL